MPPKKNGTAKVGSAKEIGSFNVGDIVLGRLKGFPMWPSRVVDPDNVNAAVAAARPSKKPDVYAVQFFPAGDFAWLNARDIKALPAHQITAYLQEGHRKGGELKLAYEVAADPSEWDTKMAEHAARQQDEDVDELEDDEEDGDVDVEDEEGGSSSKKRKAPKSKTTEKKKPKTTKEPKSKPAAEPKKKSTGKKIQLESNVDVNTVGGNDDPNSTDPVCMKVKDWRHKLQRAFLSGKSLPTAEDMDQHDETFRAIEEYKGMTIEALSYSKIGKVMKKIVTLEGIPRNDELKITERAKKLMDGWTDFIDSQPNGTARNGSSAPADKPKSVKAEESKSDVKQAKDEKADVEAAEKKAEGASDGANGEAKEETKEAEVPGSEAPTTEA